MENIKLSKSFYLHNNVVRIARDLLGKYLFTKVGGVICGGIISETEAYEGVTDKASHAFGGKRSDRTKVMYHEGGIAYVYLCYGIHSLFNVVTNIENIPHAVLIRAINPLVGIDEMLKRTGKIKATLGLTNGPGKLSRALGIHYKHSGISLSEDKIWLEDRGLKVDEKDILATTRIGIDYAGEDALLPYRFLLILNAF